MQVPTPSLKQNENLMKCWTFCGIFFCAMSGFLVTRFCRLTLTLRLPVRYYANICSILAAGIALLSTVLYFLLCTVSGRDY